MIPDVGHFDGSVLLLRGPNDHAEGNKVGQASSHMPGGLTVELLLDLPVRWMRNDEISKLIIDAP